MANAQPESPNPLQAEIDTVEWYHEFDFGGGLAARSATPDVEAHRRVWRFVEDGLAAIDFTDKSVLDVGCWDGYWSFYAERRGAASVLATDDVTQRWGSAEGIMLAKRLFGSRIEVKQDQSVYGLSRLGRKFDVILCLGVYYHLLDPFFALVQLRHCCGPGTVLALEGDTVCGNGFAPGRDRGVYVPSVAALEELLGGAYFEVRSRSFLRSGPARWAIAAMEHLPGRPVLSRPRDRVLLVCEPFSGVNALHEYEPPFGLTAYDDRFAATT